MLSSNSGASIGAPLEFMHFTLVFQAVTQLEGLDSPIGSLLTYAVMGGPVVFNDAQNISNPHWRGIQCQGQYSVPYQ